MNLEEADRARRDALLGTPIFTPVDEVKPPRLRVLELPKQTLGEATTTPFILVFDRCGDDALMHWDLAKEKTGAQAVLVFRGEIELGGTE